MSGTMWGVLLAAIFVPVIHQIFQTFAKGGHDAVWKHMPDGWLRRLLLRRVDGGKDARPSDQPSKPVERIPRSGRE